MPLCYVCGKKAGGFSLRAFNTATGRCDQCDVEATQRKVLAVDQFRSRFRELSNAGTLTKQDWENLEGIAARNGVSLETVATHIREDLFQIFRTVMNSQPVTFASDDASYLADVLSLPSCIIEEAKTFAKLEKEVAVSCVRCAAGVQGRSGDYDYTCSACGVKAIMARCETCSEIVQISEDYFKKDFECPICSEFRYWSGWNRCRIRLGETIQAFKEEQRIVADPDRRRAYGMFLGGSGYKIPIGYGALLDFTVDDVVISRYKERQERDIVGRATYSDVKSLQIGGQGVITNGGGWVGGGFGVTGIISGVLLASALNQITTRSAIETLVYFKTTAGELILLNNHFTPDHLRIMLSPALTRIENAHRQLGGPPSSILEHLRQLGELRASGTISEDEFQLLKSKLISSA